MNDKQMEELIIGIRESESQSYELGQVLENFNESFTKFMSQVVETGKLGEIEAAQEKISQLNSTLKRIEAAVAQSKKEVITQVAAAQETMKAELMEDFKRVMALQGGSYNMSQGSLGSGMMQDYSDTAVYREGVIFSIQPSRQAITIYQPLFKAQKVVYETKTPIKNIFLWEEYVWILLEDQSLCAIDTEEWSVQALEDKKVVKVRPIQKGILILDDQKELMLYASEEEAAAIASGVIDFEVLSNGQLMYEEVNEAGECIYHMQNIAAL